MNQFEAKNLEDIKLSLSKLLSPEIVIWRVHVINNPYRGTNISEEIVKLLTKELTKRGVDVEPLEAVHDRELRPYAQSKRIL
jgi:uncharacterized FAD-dependent dehydrogenase